MPKKDFMKVELSFEKVGEEIRNARKLVKMNLSDFKSIHYTALSKIENGQREPSLKQVKDIFSEMFPGTDIEVSFK